MRPFFENNVLRQQSFKPMIIVVDTTKAGSASNTFVLPIIKATTETVKIYWGDGTNSIGVNGNNTYVYAASGVYTVKIESKIFGGLYFNNGGDKAKITKVVSSGRGVVRSVTNSFFGCTSLTTIPLLNLSSVTNATNMFLGVTLTTQSYSDFLINLATLPLQSGVSFHGGNSKYNPTAATARAYLISNFGWTITDGGAA